MKFDHLVLRKII